MATGSQDKIALVPSLTHLSAATFAAAGKLNRTRTPRNPTHLKRADVRGLEYSRPVNRTKM